jgi:UDP-N-acetylglucosamine--N-acetylmuramyl-(pentapeptide) pyrophosphoryl-undecaprenol N-acetylglucosamine transferase
MAHRPLTFIFAGGGTGGHLYPALAIWQELQAMRPGEVEARFLCSSRPVDREVLTPEGVAFTPLPAQYPGLQPRQLWRFISNWPASVRIARRVIAEARGPGAGGSRAVHMVTLGGFVAAPAVQAARVERVGVTLVNIDAVPGKANRWIAGRIATMRDARSGGAYEAFSTVASKEFPRWTTVPPVVRREVSQVHDAVAARAELGIAPGLKVLLVTGGSLGAKSLNDLLVLISGDGGHRAALAGWHVLHQTGTDAEAARVAEAYRQAGVPATVAGLTRALPVWWAAADVAMSRAGAGAVAEAWATKTPTLFAPYPYHADEHQKFNAQQLVAAGAAVLAKDLVEAEANVQGELGQILLRLLRDGQARETLAIRARRLGPADGARRIAEKLAYICP